LAVELAAEVVGEVIDHTRDAPPDIAAKLAEQPLADAKPSPDFVAGEPRAIGFEAARHRSLDTQQNSSELLPFDELEEIGRHG
jgi:hypothetical protein